MSLPPLPGRSWPHGSVASRWCSTASPRRPRRLCSTPPTGTRSTIASSDMSWRSRAIAAHRTNRSAAAFRSRHAARRGVGGNARPRSAEGRGGLPLRYGDLCRGWGQRARLSRCSSFSLSACLKSLLCQSLTATDRFRIRHRPFGLGRGNASSCPIVAIAVASPAGLTGVETGHSFSRHRLEEMVPSRLN